ncbi:hypothetical protein F2Q69_00011793 [Brassica cretica]|uniref:DUF1985 domain-containing protein n=1 Tax=Brassica cretica TaxID=69181 RepID=A0A8S9R5E6_BRACR|nr:hypothetical protein F2Q69_00011793 [Brassica cretica]
MEENDGMQRPPCLLPERIFAVGEEPADVRVTQYHKADGIRQILSALDPHEVEQIRVSPFGKLVEIAEKPSFSGRFGRYIMSRQLRVFKKHEAWFLFAGKPISVVKMMRKKMVVDPEIKLKYAYLSLLAAVILPRTHTPRISHEAAGMIKDIDAFFAYPWGRVSFDMLMSSLKEKKEVALSQNPIALKGFVLSLQLVMVECVPALTEVVQEGSSSGSDRDSGDDDDTNDHEKGGKKHKSWACAGDRCFSEDSRMQLVPNLENVMPSCYFHLQALVQSVMLDSNGETNVAADHQWSDDEDDVGVGNMVKLIDQRFPFTPSCFVGGSTKDDVSRMREASKAELLNRKTVKTKRSSSSQVQDGVDLDLLASIVREKMKEDFMLVHGNISTLQESVNGFTETILLNLHEVFGTIQDSTEKIATLCADIRTLASTLPAAHLERTNRRPSVANAGSQTIPDATTIITEAVNFANRSTESLTADDDIGLNKMAGVNTTTGANTVSEINSQAGGQAVESRPLCPQNQHLRPQVGESDPDLTLDPALLFPNPTFSLGLMQEATVDARKKDKVSANTEQAMGDEVNIEATIEEADIGCRKSKRQKVPTKTLMGEYECDKGVLNRARKAVTDSIYHGGSIDYAAKFASLVEKMKTSFCISTERGSIQNTELEEVLEREKQLSTKAVDVFMFHISTLFLSRPSPNQDSSCVFMDTQFVSQFTKFSGVSSVLFIQAHALGGVDACKCITLDVLDSEVDRLLVTLYEATVGPL